MYLMKIGTWQIASRRSIVVEEESINANLRDGVNSSDPSTAGCSSSGDGGCGGAIRSKEIVLKLRFDGSGDIAAAKHLYDSLDTYLGDICRASPQTWQRRVCAETIEEETVVQAYMQRLDMNKEFRGIRTGEVHLITQDISDEVEIATFIINPLPPAAA